jgi:hypothetical protein
MHPSPVNESIRSSTGSALRSGNRNRALIAPLCQVGRDEIVRKQREKRQIVRR